VDSQKEKKDRRKFIALIGIIAALCIITVCLIPFVKEMLVEESREQLIQWVQSKGALGVFALLGLQILQVVVAVIPGEMVEVAAGILYGTFWGYVVCTVGVLLSSCLVFFTVRKLGRGFVEDKISKEKLNQFKFLQDPHKRNLIVFLLFFIPGTPKDLLTYVVPLTSMKASHFLVLSALARIPSIVSSTYAGATIQQGRFEVTLLVFVVTGLLGIAGIFFNEKIVQALHKAHIRKKGGTV
jgi:uncharacterized membrane protein YdjX (TVP38/TMEM64 family)